MTVQGQECSPLININAESEVRAMTFTANGRCLMSGQYGGNATVRVWRLEDGNQVTEMKATWVNCVAASKDAKWIAAGTAFGAVFVWNAMTYEQVLRLKDDAFDINGVDFSPDSTRIVSASNNGTTIVSDIATRNRALTLRHKSGVDTAKYSPQGDRIATTTGFNTIFIWDSNDGRLLIEVFASAPSGCNKGLLWFNDHPFFVSAEGIKQLDISNKSIVSKLPVPDTGHYSCITLPQHGRFIVYATKRSVTFWDTSTYVQLGLTIQHPEDISSISISPDDRFLAIGGKKGRISIQSLSSITDVNPEPNLREWAEATLVDRSWRDALLSAERASSTFSRSETYRVICEHLESIDHITDAVECFHQMMNELGGEMSMHDEDLQWVLDFRQRFSKKLEYLGDAAVDALRLDEAISGILIKRSEAHVASGLWKRALDDANQAITLDLSSPWGYEIKHVALSKAGDYEGAIKAFEAMLSKTAESPDQNVQRGGDKYISPSSTRTAIRKIVQQTIRHSPRILIDTTTGRLQDRTERASAFESHPIFNELVSSMTTRIDYIRIKREVRQYFRYVMLSHKWESNEPLFHHVAHIAVYDLDQSSTHDKLQTFCKIVRDAGFNWAWSDTCCIDKSDHFVLQEALVAMFKWYQGSAMMIVFLRGVYSSSQRGALVNSIWNTRAWTLQEYVASKIVHFYTEEWTLYQDLSVPNHKESSEVISEMEQATGVSAQELMALRPGLTSIREKLRLASTRETTLVEDVAYSLLGIFSTIGIPAIYGEGEASLGRLLANILTRSGDVSVLAWTGESGRFNSCLPDRIAVFNGPATSHLPLRISATEMEGIVIASNSSSFDLSTALKLYDRLNELPTARFAETRMTLPCIAFQLPPLSLSRIRSGRVYRAATFAFGMVEIKTRQDLSRMKSLYLVHPWLDTLLEREDMHGDAFAGDDEAPPPSPDIGDDEIADEEIDEEDEFENDSSSLVEPELSLPPTPTLAVPMDKETRARRLVAHLKQPFGALFLAPTGRRALDYTRVAADSQVTVRFQDNVSLVHILENIRTLDVL